MKHIFSIPLFFALLFFTATPTHSMGLFRAVKKLVTRKSQEQAQLLSDADVQACAQSAFAKTGFPAELLALVVGYCTDFKLGVITLPYLENVQRLKRVAVQVNLDGDILTVLTTTNKLFKYQLPEGILISQNPANLGPNKIYFFKNNERLVVDDIIMPSREDSVFVADSILCPDACNEHYLAKIVGNLSELKVDFFIHDRMPHQDAEGTDSCVSEILVSKYGQEDESRISAHGYCYYDCGPPCTTIKISLQPKVLARMLGFELAQKESSG